MIVERHYDEEALISILQGDESGDARDPHLSACSTCAETLASYRDVIGVLADASVWDSNELREEPSRETIARLRAFTMTREAETDVADLLVSALLQEPREAWADFAARDIRYLNAGIARALIAESEKAIDTDPKDAVAMAHTAVVVADLIDETEYESDVVARLRGAAGRQYAYALFIVGESHEALQYVDRAQRELDRCAVADYDIARLNIVRALVYRSLDKFQDAIRLSREAAQVFEAYGDRQRFSSARMAEAYLLMQQSQYREALPILRKIETRLTSDADLMTRALTLGNIAVCQSNLNQTLDALNTYKVVEAIFDELGARVEAARIRANVAMLLRANGHVVEAKSRMLKLEREARDLGLRYLAASVQLELADIMLAEGRFEEATGLCGDVLEYFKSSGSQETEGPMVALTYLREAADQRRLSSSVVRHVKRYIEKAEKQPRLLFAPPPLPPR